MSARPLRGLRVLDLTRLLPGGICTLRLAELGADVLKVEQPGTGDYARNREPHYDGSEASTTSATFIGLNRGKGSIVLDLKTEDDRECFLALAREADVVVESFRPGVLDRLGVGYETLRARNPGIVHCSISGWGPDGPWAQRAGHDINYLAAAGLLSLSGDTEEEPVTPAFQLADGAGGLTAVGAILAAVLGRERTGAGCSVDVSLAHSALSVFAMGAAAALSGAPVVPREQSLFGGGVVCYQAYRCRDGWVALGALEERFWRAWCEAVERPDLFDSRYEPTGSAAHAEVARIFAARDSADWAAFAARVDCCLTVVRGLADALRSDLVEPLVVAVDQPGIEPPVPVLGAPIRFSGEGPVGAELGPAPALGADQSFATEPPSRQERTA